jgi:hypothetical protein
MANRLLEPAPRDEQKIIRTALRSGVFMKSAPSTRAALIKRMEVMETNAQFKAVQDRRRTMEESKRAQMDYDRQLSETMQRRIAPLQTFNHQMNDRRRMSQQILGN